MELALNEQRKSRISQAPWGSLPPRMRVLYIAARHSADGDYTNQNWLADAFAADSATSVVMESADSAADGLARLRDEVFDAILASHDPPHLDALDLVEGLRGSGSDEPAIVLGYETEDEMNAWCYEVGADAYLCVPSTTTRCLLWTVARAVERAALLRENCRMVEAERQRAAQENEEAGRLLDQQKLILTGAPELVDGSTGTLTSDQATADLPDAWRWTVAQVPPELSVHYHELLRAYVIMGSGSLGDEIRALADSLVTAGMSAAQTMSLHLHVLDQVIRSLGNRSARHVMNRANLLIMDLLVKLSDGYRQKASERTLRRQQLLLPGFATAPWLG